MKQRASSSSATSSSAALPPANGWFQPLEGETLRLTVHKVDYMGTVLVVNEVESSIDVRLVKPRTSCFDKSDEATLLRSGGDHRWFGNIISTSEDEDPRNLFIILKIRVSSEGEDLRSLDETLVTVKPVAKLQSSHEVARIGVKGFGMIERSLIEMGCQSIDVKVVAIHSPSMSPEDMANVWKSPNVSIAVKDSKTLIFSKRNYMGNPRDENGVSALYEHMEVTVFRKPNQIPWEQANVDFVVECSAFFNKDEAAKSNDESQVTNRTEGSNNCLSCLPKVLDAFGLYADEIVRSQFHSAEVEHLRKFVQKFFPEFQTERRIAKFNIVTSSSATAKAIRHTEIFPDWNEDPASMTFAATTSLAARHRLADIDMSIMDLQVTLVKAEKCSGIESIQTRFCDADEEVYRRLKAIMSWCLDIIRCMTIGACCLELA